MSAPLPPPTPALPARPRCPTCQSEYGDGPLYCPRDGALLLPTVLEGRYRLLSPLGAGGMGTVYLAEHVGLQKRVAVKVLRVELSRDATFARRFELEAVAASQMGHENIVDVTDLGRTPGGELFYVMELLEGGPLSGLLLRERFLPLPRAVRVLSQVCRALEAAHARGIVHRDVKPHNVMLVPREGRADFVKVVDFGISKMTGLEGGKLTQVGAILGTADYMAPEQATGGEVDASADVYAVGVMAYELVTGGLPFRGDNTFATLLQHVERTPEPPGRRRPELGLPPELDALLLQALAKDPSQRPSMARLRAGLEALPPGRAPLPLTQQAAPAPALLEAASPTRAAPSSHAPASHAPVSDVSAAAAYSPTVVRPAPAPPAPPAASRGVRLAGVAALLAALAGGGAWLARGASTPAASSGAPSTLAPSTLAPSPVVPVAGAAPVAPAPSPPAPTAAAPTAAAPTAAASGDAASAAVGAVPAVDARTGPPAAARPASSTARRREAPRKVQDLKPNPF